MEKELLELILIEVKESKQRLKNLESVVIELKQDMKEVKARVVTLEQEMKEVKTRLTCLEEKVESNSKDLYDIKEIVAEHYDEFIKFKKHNSVQHNLYDARLLKFEEECEEYINEQKNATN